MNRGHPGKEEGKSFTGKETGMQIQGAGRQEAVADASEGPSYAHYV